MKHSIKLLSLASAVVLAGCHASDGTFDPLAPLANHGKIKAPVVWAYQAPVTYSEVTPIVREIPQHNCYQVTKGGPIVDGCPTEVVSATAYKAPKPLNDLIIVDPATGANGNDLDCQVEALRVYNSASDGMISGIQRNGLMQTLYSQCVARKKANW